MFRNKTIKQLGIVSIVLLVLSLFFAAGATLGQAADPPPEPETSEAREAEYILAQPPYTMNYQGYLTNSSGSPLNGTYTLAFLLHNHGTQGTQVWGPEIHSDQQVTNGLFQVVLGSTLTLRPNIFKEALFLGGADQMVPR